MRERRRGRGSAAYKGCKSAVKLSSVLGGGGWIWDGRNRRKETANGCREGGSKRARGLLVRHGQSSMLGAEPRAESFLCPPLPCRAFIAAKASCSDGANVVITAADVEEFKAIMNTQRATARAHRR